MELLTAPVGGWRPRPARLYTPRKFRSTPAISAGGGTVGMNGFRGDFS